MKIKDLEIIENAQSLYDNFNGFILSNDFKVFGKLLARTLLMDRVKDIPGDIVECGVFKGTGILTYLKLKRYLNPNSGKKVIGFDFFDSDKLVKTLDGIDKDAMKTLFEGRDYEHKSDDCSKLISLIKNCGFLDHEYDLIPGDITKTAPEYISDKPGFKISLLYIDLDLEIPTYEALGALWDRVSTGGMVVFDEYGFHKWSESKGVDRFFSDKKVKIKSLDYICPTAYIVKE